GFTLVELLVVISIIGVLATVMLGGFYSTQVRGRDSQRKSNIKELANALELYLNDYGAYPAANGSGQIMGCVDGLSVCTWGTSSFTDGKTVYFKQLPKDPVSTSSYYYRIVDSPTNKKYQLYARLENSQDKDCIGGDCANPPSSLPMCGSALCNFSLTSANTTPTE
ncbi:prepilin-type N-terminal cleavage/methylation domain-containing protein, partial [Candidatus Microgenomates bacterium]|nr:prepilin-type N-terminal cleavage/methylation domain-containing protein [Candidatus Microgenomates bacterium]